MPPIPSVTGGASGASNGDTSTNSVFTGNGLTYNRGNGVPGWAIAAAAAVAFIGFIYLNKGEKK